MYPEWTPPPAVLPVPPNPPNRRRGRLAAAGLVGAGVVAGAMIGATALSSAATSSSSPSSSASSSSSSSTSGEANETHQGHGLDLSGTVTAVGTSSVTIKTSTATTQYAVSSTSDIDKNGESTLSKLVVGDAVTFSVDTVSNVQTIDKLHAGSEALDRPQGDNGSGG